MIPPRRPDVEKPQRGNLLVRWLPNPRYNRAAVRHLVIPSFLPPAIFRRPFDLPPPAVASVPLVQERPNISGPATLLNSQPVGAAEIDCAFTAQVRTVGAEFDVRVYGKLYRSRTATVLTPEKPTGAMAEAKKQLALGIEPTPVKEPEPEKRNAYSDLYDLLYPPPDQYLTENIPQAKGLYSYQKDGIRFLMEREGALLADDMGLGKTPQCVLAMTILRRTERVGRTLVICPRALIHQWEKELARWGGLYGEPLEGSPTVRKRQWQHSPRVLLATPDLVRNDLDAIKECHFDLVVCDDVSLLKNRSQTSNAIRSIPRTRSWCLNGTPIENKPEDLLNVMEFVRPGLFKATECLTPQHMQQRIRPYFLRRKQQGLLDLPPLYPVGPIELELRGEQLTAYERCERCEWEALQKSGVKITRIHIFSIINALIQLCNFDPASGQSVKLELLEEELVLS